MIFLIQTYEGDVSDLELTFSWDVDNMGKVLYIQTYSVYSTHTLTSTCTGYVQTNLNTLQSTVHWRTYLWNDDWIGKMT